MQAAEENKGQKQPADPRNEIIKKIRDSNSILIAVNNSPTIDELVSAIAMTVALDKIGKHATSIFSGHIPEQIEFLQPEKTFEIDTNSLQDFIISLNKDKADHIRIKNDGDFVRVYITPYRTTITPEDLSFSRGDFNIDLVVALNVPVVANLDAAIAEQGRIMHNASVVNISTGEPGRFGDIIWAVPGASSMAELTAMILDGLRNAFEGGELIDQSVATAMLTGLVSATDRFSNAKTTPVVMNLASRLMSLGANQAEVSSNLLGREARVTVEHNAQSHAENPTTPPPPLMGANEMQTGVTALPVIDKVTAPPSTAPPEAAGSQDVNSGDFLTPNADILTHAKTIEPPKTTPSPSEVIAPELADLAKPTDNIPTPPPSPPPVAPPPAPTPPPPPPKAQGTAPTVQEIQHMLEEGLPLPPEFDPRLSAPTLEKPTDSNNTFQVPGMVTG
ncbi:hypothetical protein FWH13_02645 [Candidatus Saccharibacteria bacterium]|nr:hypothetical protein [Candidatus Saccharibacteria bacterium]